MKISSQRYEDIKVTIADIYEDYNVQDLPIDIFGLAKIMNCKIVKSSVLLSNNIKKTDDYLFSKYPSSFLYYDSIKQQFMIYLDDVEDKRQRQRFSLAHEITHIVLEHDSQNDINEAEANFGASYLLAPTSLILIPPFKNILLNPEKVAKIFDISKPAAEIVVKYNNQRITSGSPKEKDYEKRINNLLKWALNDRINDLRL